MIIYIKIYIKVYAEFKDEMMRYRYTLTKLSTNKHFIKRNVICQATSIDDVPNEVYKYLLEDKRTHRINKLFINFNESRFNTEAVRAYLPSQYKRYAENLDQLKEQMISLYEISQKYIITDIELTPDCYGCLYDSPGQRDHMECPTGCLHDVTKCYTCI